LNVLDRCTHVGKTLVALLTAGLVLGGVLTGVGPAAAAGRAGITPVKGPVSFEPGRYIVVLRTPSASGYAGGAGFARTRAAFGGRFDARSRAVIRYSAHRRQTHRTVADEVGARVARMGIRRQGEIGIEPANGHVDHVSTLRWHQCLCGWTSR